jgi:hypothetical protein
MGFGPKSGCASSIKIELPGAIPTTRGPTMSSLAPSELSTARFERGERLALRRPSPRSLGLSASTDCSAIVPGRSAEPMSKGTSSGASRTSRSWSPLDFDTTNLSSYLHSTDQPGTTYGVLQPCRFVIIAGRPMGTCRLVRRAPTRVALQLAYLLARATDSETTS